MKPFNLELAKQGKPVCTRDGKPARIICFDRNSPTFPIVALVSETDGNEYTREHALNGKYGDAISPKDLFMVGEKKIGWINIYVEDDYYTVGKVYDSEQDAIDAGTPSRIDTIQIEFKV